MAKPSILRMKSTDEEREELVEVPHKPNPRSLKLKPNFVFKEVYYAQKSWIEEPFPTADDLIKQKKWKLIGRLDEDNAIVMRELEKDPIFMMFHVSWGKWEAVQKYKLYLVDIFKMFDRHPEKIDPEYKAYLEF